MKPLAARARALTQSDIRAVTFEANAAGALNLGQGICDLGVPDPIVRGVEEALHAGKSIYTAYNGVAPLREAIAGKAQAFNQIPIAGPENVAVSAGSTGAFVSTVLALCEAGDEVVLFEPFYGYHSGILNLYGVAPVGVPLAAPTEAHPRWAFDPERLAAAITERTKAVLVCTPANPSGKMWTHEELGALYEIAERHDLWVITDEIYEHMTYDGREHLSPASLPGAFERTVTISGFSKTFNVTGWRLGYAVAPAALAETMGLVSDLVYICAPAPLQHGLAAALPMPEAYYRQMLADYAAKREMMVGALRDCGFSIAPPEGAYYAFTHLGSRLGTPGFGDAHEATQTLIHEAGVGCVPGPSFFSDPADGMAYLRFCYAKEMSVLEEACRRLRAHFGVA